MESNEFFPGMKQFYASTLDKQKSITRQYTDIFSSTLNLFEFALQVFIISTIRVYEDRLVKEGDEYKKKTKPILDTLKTRFVAPSLGTLITLAKSCYYLIDDTAPRELILMKKGLETSLTLGTISKYLTDLRAIFEILEETKEDTPKIIYNPTTKKSLLSIINEFVSFRNESAHLLTIGTIIEDNANQLNIKLESWIISFDQLIKSLTSILSNQFKYKSIDKILTENQEKILLLSIRTFSSGLFNDSTEKMKLDDWYEYQWNEKLQIVFTYEEGEVKEYDLFPFITFNNDRLFYYKKTRTSGYHYFSLADSKTLTIKSKKKFSRAIFNSFSSGNSQALFWTEIAPVISPTSKIKANIPNQGSSQFIGRKKQISKIKEEIIEIPNQNGILYGPGGVGKTALLIELSQQLFNQTETNNILYDNIIWVSAKSNFYNWEQNSTITSLQQFESLINILQIILRFFDYEDVDEYNESELKEMVFEILTDNKVILVLDNFETISKSETNKIIDFFGSAVKKHLKHLPHNFKVIITSRELIPSGYYQIKLEGLELKESNQLIKSIYEKYKDSHAELTEDQCKLIHDATSGIPIVIKHCLGQMFEFQIPLTDILNKLSEASNEVIKFSFSEVLSQLKRDECYLQILILLDIINEPISARQIGVILEISNTIICNHIPKLLNFLCIDKLNVGIEEKYRISNQIGLLAKSITKENKDIANEIRKKIANNLTIEKRMDYAFEELEIIEIFNGYVDARDYTYAEHFLNAEMNKRPNSQLLKFHYAIFLRDRKKDFKRAIEILEKLDSEISRLLKKDANILIALVSTYSLLEYPDFEKADRCCNELLNINQDKQFSLFVGEFYISWSSILKNSRELDPIKEIYRKSKVKELAGKGISLLEGIKEETNTHKYQHVIAQAYFNQWNTEKTIEHLKRAIDLAQNDFASQNRYERFLETVKQYLD